MVLECGMVRMSVDGAEPQHPQPRDHMAGPPSTPGAWLLSVLVLSWANCLLLFLCHPSETHTDEINRGAHSHPELLGTDLPIQAQDGGMWLLVSVPKVPKAPAHSVSKGKSTARHGTALAAAFYCSPLFPCNPYSSRIGMVPPFLFFR